MAGAEISNTATLTLGFVVVYIIYNITVVIYNIYFHPLRGFPGPSSRAGLHANDLWHLAAGSHTHTIKKLHDTYGPVVRTRPDTLTFNTTDAWKDIYGSRPGKGQLQKDSRFYRVAGETKTHIVFCNDEDHTRMRKLLSHAFSDAALRQQEPLMTDYFELLVSQLKKKIDGDEDGEVDLAMWYNFLTFDIIGDLCFGESFGALESGKYHKWMGNLLGGAKYGRFMIIASFYQPLMIILNALMGLIPAVGRAHKEHDEFAAIKTQARLDRKTDRGDFMTYIQRHNDERGMSREEIMNTSGLLIIAGSETTATLLSGLTYYLLKNPQTYEKAKEEIRSSFSKAEDITLTSTGHLPYLFACMEEAFRMYPPVPLALPRITPKEGAMVAGNFVPGGTRVAVAQYASYQSASNFHNPELFVPERWMVNPPEEYQNDHTGVLNPFSTGPRNCIGKNLAYNEIRSVMARMLWHFDIELKNPTEVWEDQSIFFFWEKPALKVKLTHRKF